MVGYYKKLVQVSNAVEAAAPASVWCKGVPGKGAARNYVSGTSRRKILELCFGLRLSKKQMKKLLKATEPVWFDAASSTAPSRSRPRQASGLHRSRNLMAA